jgi:hypothetical protein
MNLLFETCFCNEISFVFLHLFVFLDPEIVFKVFFVSFLQFSRIYFYIKWVNNTYFFLECITTIFNFLLTSCFDFVNMINIPIFFLLGRVINSNFLIENFYRRKNLKFSFVHKLSHLFGEQLIRIYFHCIHRHVKSRHNFVIGFCVQELFVFALNFVDV